MALAPENEKPGIIKDHSYQPANPDEPWGPCISCGLAEAAHIHASSPYFIPEGTPHRCPDCVTQDVSPCVHGPGS